MHKICTDSSFSKEQTLYTHTLHTHKAVGANVGGFLRSTVNHAKPFSLYVLNTYQTKNGGIKPFVIRSITQIHSP